VISAVAAAAAASSIAAATTLMTLAAPKNERSHTPASCDRIRGETIDEKETMTNQITAIKTNL